MFPSDVDHLRDPLMGRCSAVNLTGPEQHDGFSTGFVRFQSPFGNMDVIDPLSRLPGT
jgi:hypothetical protein